MSPSLFVNEPKVGIKTQFNIIPQQNHNFARQTTPVKFINSKIRYKKIKKYKLLGTFRLTAYCPCCDCSEGYGNHTSTGAVATQGRTIAVDPDIIPYGTNVKIKGMGKYVAEDCGGAIDGNRIDIYFSSHNAAQNFGVKSKKVYIKNKEKSK